MDNVCDLDSGCFTFYNKLSTDCLLLHVSLKSCFLERLVLTTFPYSFSCSCEIKHSHRENNSTKTLPIVKKNQTTEHLTLDPVDSVKYFPHEISQHVSQIIIRSQLCILYLFQFHMQ